MMKNTAHRQKAIRGLMRMLSFMAAPFQSDLAGGQVDNDRRRDQVSIASAKQKLHTAVLPAGVLLVPRSQWEWLDQVIFAARRMRDSREIRPGAAGRPPQSLLHFPIGPGHGGRLFKIAGRPRAAGARARGVVR